MHLGNIVDGLSIEASCPTALSHQRGPAANILEAADGSFHAIIYKSLATPRVWSATVRGPSHHLSSLTSLATNPAWYSRADLQFLPTGAGRVNALTPSESSLEHLPSYSENLVSTEVGEMLGYIAGDQYTRWVTKTLPIPPNNPLCVSAFIPDKSTARVSWRDPSGAELRQDSKPLASSGEAKIYSRAHTVFTPPQGATAAWIGFTHSFTAPAVTFGQSLYPYGIGQRAASVLVKAGTTTLLSAVPNVSQQTYVEDTFEIVELDAR